MIARNRLIVKFPDFTHVPSTFLAFVCILEISIFDDSAKTVVVAKFPNSTFLLFLLQLFHLQLFDEIVVVAKSSNFPIFLHIFCILCFHTSKFYVPFRSTCSCAPIFNSNFQFISFPFRSSIVFVHPPTSKSKILIKKIIFHIAGNLSAFSRLTLTARIII